MVRGSLKILEMEKFYLSGVMVQFSEPEKLSLRLESFMTGHIPVSVLAGEFPFSVLPVALFKMGEEIIVEVALSGDIGRKRPKFHVMLLGEAECTVE